MRPSPRDLLLVDGLGACVSAALLGIALPAVHERIGMPLPVLRLLAGIAMLLAASSLAGYRLAGDRAAGWLRATLVANLLYCLLTGVLVAIHLRSLTPWGLAYFVAEAAVILALALVERRALRATPGRGVA